MTPRAGPRRHPFPPIPLEHPARFDEEKDPAASARTIGAPPPLRRNPHAGRALPATTLRNHEKLSFGIRVPVGKSTHVIPKRFW